jgi:hypothetical protein
MPAPTEERARAYLAKLPPAVAGNGGHAATFAAACRLVEFGLSYEAALPVLCEWNGTHCQPPWSEGDLRHKLADAFKRTAPKRDFATSSVTLPPRPQVSPLNELRSRAAHFLPGTAQEIVALAKLRGLCRAGLSLATERGLLRFGRYNGAPAWVCLDASHRNGCARRMDGAPWPSTGAKALLFRGVHAQWPVGLAESQPFPNVLLCEGAPDLLAAFHFMAAQGRAADCAPVAMLSASYRLPEAALDHFTGKRVRIFAHDDAAGYAAAARWLDALAPHARAVDAFAFAGVRTRDGGTANDLNSFAHAEQTDDNERLLANLLP